jgi:methionyl-tRNA synthetase
MSKSLGNVVRPLEMKKRYSMDAFRYFLLRDMVFGQDAVFSLDGFVNRVNADLANNLGNLVSRVLAMQKKYFNGLERFADIWTGSVFTGPWSPFGVPLIGPISISFRPHRSC